MLSTDDMMNLTVRDTADMDLDHGQDTDTPRTTWDISQAHHDMTAVDHVFHVANHAHPADMSRFAATYWGRVDPMSNTNDMRA